MRLGECVQEGSLERNVTKGLEKRSARAEDTQRMKGNFFGFGNIVVVDDRGRSIILLYLSMPDQVSSVIFSCLSLLSGRARCTLPQILGEVVDVSVGRISFKNLASLSTNPG